jgi:hypothetical protein
MLYPEIKKAADLRHKNGKLTAKVVYKLLFLVGARRFELPTPCPPVMSYCFYK